MKTGKRVFAVLLVLAVMLSMMSLAVYAEETGYEPTNAYVLSYNYSSYGVPRWGHFSPYKPRLSYNGTWKGDVGTSVSTFNVINVNNNEVIEAYCVDSDVSIKTSGMYRRTNLEDSTYSAATARKLRAVVTHGFPYVSLEDMRAASGVSDLTVDEAQVAVQLAVWESAHGELFDIISFLNGITDASKWSTYKEKNYMTSYDACYQEVADGYATMDNAETISSHIEAAYNYLMALEPEVPQEASVSGSSFTEWGTPVLTQNEDGTVDVSITVSVDVVMKAGDALTLTAMVGGCCSESAELTNGANTKTLTIRNVPAPAASNDITLAIDGEQTVRDVFFFDAYGDRGASQSLIALADNQLPVHAEIVAVQQERVINICKTSDGEGLEGIHFDVYYTASYADVLSGDAVRDYSYSGYADYTIVTDSDGFGSLNLSRQNLPDGLYLIVERSHSAITAPVDPFYVIIPATNAEGTGYEYTVNVYPKNDVKEEVEIVKDVIAIDQDKATVDAYAPHTWIIGASIPSDLADGKSYVVSDTLDPRLDFLGNVRVQVEDYLVRESNSVEPYYQDLDLTEGIDYILTVTDEDSLAENTPSDSFIISLTEAGMNKAANGSMLRIYFDAQINANAEMGVEIPNEAVLDYTNSVGIDFQEKSDKPEVYTGGALLVKIDATDHSRTLPGAEFRVYRKATEKEVADETVAKEYIGEMVEPMVPVAFFNNPDLTVEKVTTAVSDENGNVYIYGLAYGTYYLVESKAPAGYNLPGEPIELTVSETSHQAVNAVRVENVSGAVLPETGGIGTMVFIFPGMLLVAAAAVLLLQKKRKFI